MTEQDPAPVPGFDRPYGDLPAIEDRTPLVELARPWYPGVLCVYPYYDKNGRPVYLHVRVDAGDHPSKFRWCTISEDGKQLIPGKQAPGVGVVVEPLYGFRRAAEQGQGKVLWIAEGEKDCDVLWQTGFIAVSMPDGASKVNQRVKWRDHYTDAVTRVLKPQLVVVLGDHDDPGLWTRDKVAERLTEGGCEAAIYRAHPPEQGHDLADHLEAGKELRELVFQSPDVAPTGPPPAVWEIRGVARGDDYGWVDDGRRRIKRGDYNDSGYAEWFADHYGDRVRYDHNRKLWLVFTDHHWQPDEDDQVGRWIKEMMYRRIHTAPPSDEDKLAKLAVRYLSRDKRSAVRDAARSEPPIADAGHGWNPHNHLLACGNGVVDLRTSEARPGRPEDRFSLWTPVPYDPRAEAPRWERFLKEVFGGDSEIVAYVQRYLGYCTTGETSEQVLALCRGTKGGANGKGKLFFALRNVLGRYAYTLPFSALATVGHRGEKAWSLADLPGKRLVMSSETQEGAWFSTDRVKALTGQDELNVERKHQDPFTFVPVAKYLLAVNTLPNVPSDKAFWRRVRVLPFDQQFDQHSQEAQQLDAELAAELSGILAWLVQGAKAWYQSGLEPTPRAVDLATKEYEKGQDPLADYFEQRLEFAPKDAPEEYWVRKSELREDYERYCKSHGVRPVKGFVAEMESRGLKGSTVFDEQHEKSVAVWKGARFKIPT